MQKVFLLKHAFNGPSGHFSLHIKIFVLIVTLKTCILIDHWSMQLTVVSSGSQLLLTNSLLFYFKSKKDFILKICKVRHLEKKCLSWKVKLFCLTGLLFTQHVLNARLWIENHWWNVRVFIKKQIMKPFFRKYFALQTVQV